MNAPARTAAADDNRLPLVTVDQLRHDFAHVETAIAALEKREAESAIVLEDDEDLASVTGLVGEVSRAIKRADELRDLQGRPHLEAKRIIDSFFRTFDTRLGAIKTKISQRATAYMNKKAEAERQVRLAAEAKAREAAAQKEREAAAAIQANKPSEAHAAQAAADNLHAVADHAGDAATAKPADLARTQTDSGTATLAQSWEFEIENIDSIDLEALRPFLPRTAIEQAMRAFVKSGRRQITGARVFPSTKAMFR